MTTAVIVILWAAGLVYGSWRVLQALDKREKDKDKKKPPDA